MKMIEVALLILIIMGFIVVFVGVAYSIGFQDGIDSLLSIAYENKTCIYECLKGCE